MATEIHPSPGMPLEEQMKIIRDHINKKSDMDYFWEHRPLGLPFTLGDMTKVACTAAVIYGTTKLIRYLFESPESSIAGFTTAMDGLGEGRL